MDDYLAYVRKISWFLTSCNIFQTGLLTPFPNGPLHDRPTKIYKKKLVIFRNMTFWLVFDWISCIWNSVNSERSLSKLAANYLTAYWVTSGFHFHTLSFPHLYHDNGACGCCWYVYIQLALLIVYHMDVKIKNRTWGC